MPSTAAAAATKRKCPTFSPHRPKNSNATNANGRSTANASESKHRNAASKQPKASRFSSPTSSESDSADESAVDSTSRSPSPTSEPDYILAEVTHNENAEENEPRIPTALIHTLLNHHFKDKDKTRISQDAKTTIGKYVDTFVRESIARSAFERQDKSAGDAAEALSGRGDDGWLEVEDLEKMAPQLVLDF
jgi:CENP-S associating Centromere protein X